MTFTIWGVHNEASSTYPGYDSVARASSSTTEYVMKEEQTTMFDKHKEVKHITQAKN